MAFVSGDRVKETTTTAGTGTLSLAGAASGFRAFSAVCANNDTVAYCIVHQSSAEWEVGVGTWTTGNNLARTTVLSSSNGGSAVDFSAGTKDVFNTLNARIDVPQVTFRSKTAPMAAAAAGTLNFYSRNRGGRMLPEFIGPSGLDSGIQPALFGNSVTLWLPGTSTTVAINFGVSWTTTTYTTQAHPTIADTSIMTAMRRATFTTTTTSGNASGVRTASAVVIRNRGFFFFARFGILTYTSSMQIMVGLTALSTNLAGEPSSQNDSAYCGKDSGETVWQCATRDTSAASKTSSGRTTAAAGNTDIFDFTMFCKPADSKITMRLVDMCDGTVLVDNVEKSSNLPTNATVLYAHAACRNSAGGAGSAVAIFLSRIYIETDI